MVRLRQVDRPADNANWTEYFYNGELRVVRGVAETENPDWILQMLQTGYRIIEDENEPSSPETPPTGSSEATPSTGTATATPGAVVVEDTTATPPQATPRSATRTSGSRSSRNK